MAVITFSPFEVKNKYENITTTKNMCSMMKGKKIINNLRHVHMYMKQSLCCEYRVKQANCTMCQNNKKYKNLKTLHVHVLYACHKHTVHIHTNMHTVFENPKARSDSHLHASYTSQ